MITPEVLRRGTAESVATDHGVKPSKVRALAARLGIKQEHASRARLDQVEEFAAWIRDTGRVVSEDYILGMVEVKNEGRHLHRMIAQSIERGLLERVPGGLRAKPSPKQNCWTCAFAGKRRDGCAVLANEDADDVVDWLVRVGMRMDGPHAGTVPGFSDSCPAWRQG